MLRYQLPFPDVLYYTGVFFYLSTNLFYISYTIVQKNGWFDIETATLAR